MPANLSPNTNDRGAIEMLTNGTFTCHACQHAFPKSGNFQKFCRPCANQQGQTYSAVYRRRRNGGHVGHKPKDHECGRCQRPIISKAHNRRYCDECRVEARRARVRSLRMRPEKFINHRISAGIRQSLAKGKQGHRWEGLVAFTLADLLAHLESQFLPGMTWDNRGEWHIDHIRPLCSFQFQTPDDPQFREAWAMTNLRPLWARDNLRKGGRTDLLI